MTRLGLARPDDVLLTTFDLSPRVNEHLDAARRRARAGGGYVVQLPRNRNVRWDRGLVAYWEHFGNTIGEETTAAAVPSIVGNLRLRAVRIRPAAVLSIVPQDVNVVLQRLDPLPGAERFDAIIATNVLVYYDLFEQSLALVNLARMLRPGGFFLSNNALPQLPTIPLKSSGFTTTVYTDRPGDSDRVMWYQRQ